MKYIPIFLGAFACMCTTRMEEQSRTWVLVIGFLTIVWTTGFVAICEPRNRNLILESLPATREQLYRQLDVALYELLSENKIYKRGTHYCASNNDKAVESDDSDDHYEEWTQS